MFEMVYFLEYLFILQNNYLFFKIILGHLFSAYFADPVSILVFFSFLNLFFSMYASHDITTLYYMYSHFLVHEDNKNTRKIKLLIGSVKYA